MPPLPGLEFWLIWTAVLLGTAYAMRKVVQPEPVADDVGDYLPQEDKMETMPEQLTFDDALAKREAVLAEVEKNNAGWLKLAADAMRRMEAGTEGIGEDFRFLLKDHGVPDPVHPNAFGALINTMKRRGVLVETGEYRPMRGAKANGRRSPVYLLQNPEAA